MDWACLRQEISVTLMVVGTEGAMYRTKYLWHRRLNAPNGIMKVSQKLQQNVGMSCSYHIIIMRLIERLVIIYPPSPASASNMGPGPASPALVAPLDFVPGPWLGLSLPPRLHHFAGAKKIQKDSALMVRSA